MSHALLLPLGLLLLGCAIEPAPDTQFSSNPDTTDAALAPPATADSGSCTDALFSLHGPTLRVEIGQHTFLDEEESRYQPLQPNGCVNIIYGPQGSFMAVFALRILTPLEHDSSVDVTGQLRVGGEVVASFLLKNIAMERSPTGQQFAWNLFMLTHEFQAYEGRPGEFEVHLWSHCGEWLGAQSVPTVVCGP